ncbi:MAG: hypothetical protein GF329_02360, partial [Candidatus Lokiarchaeota archaeon]|nr:hypothetical protein [Candidatus Lokiarchaeota archaeon]
MSNWYNNIKLSQSIPNIMFHNTSERNLSIIIENGLKVNSEQNLTVAGSWAHKIYGLNPIYLSLDSKMYNIGVTLQVNVSGLNLAPDLPGLVDKGAYLTEDGMYWEENEEPLPLKQFLTDGEIYFQDLLTIAKEPAILTTRTAACLEDISPDR